MESSDYAEKFQSLIQELSEDRELLAAFTGEDLLPIAELLIERGFTMNDLRAIRADRELIESMEKTEELTALGGFWFA